MIPSCFDIQIVRKYGTNIVDTTNDINILDNPAYSTKRPIDTISMRITHIDHQSNVELHDDDVFDSRRSNGITLHFGKRSQGENYQWFFYDAVQMSSMSWRSLQRTPFTGARHNEIDHKMVDEIEKIYKKLTPNIKQTIIDYLNNVCPPNQIQRIADKIE